MLNDVVRALARATPALRARYLQRVREVDGPAARALEEQLSVLVARDRSQAA